MEGAGNVAVLAAIVLVYTAIKAPHFDLPLTGMHSMKYSTYVEPALYMAERNNPLWYQQKYSAEIDTHPHGVHERFDRAPLFEWGLFLSYKLVPFGNLEFKTRLFTHVVGIGILLGAYGFFARWLPRRLSLTAVFLLAINPLFLFATYVTVLDSLCMALMFGSLILLSDSLRSDDIRRLFWSGLLFGTGTLVKYSLVLWLAPLALVFLLLMRKDMASFLRNAGLYLLLGILPIVTWKTSLALLPGAPGIAILRFLPWVFAYGLLYRLLVRKQPALDRWMVWLWGRKGLLALSVGIAGVLAVGTAGALMSGKGLGSYLADPELIFSVRFYRHMLLDQFAKYMTPWVFRFGLAGLVLVPCCGFKGLARVVAAFGVGSLVYWVVASKAMFVHNYYTIIIMILFSLLAAVPLYTASLFIPWKLGRLLCPLAFAGLVYPDVRKRCDYALGHYQEVSGLVEFIRENTGPGDRILHHGVLTPLIIYTDRHFVYPHSLDYAAVGEDIKQLGFAGAMRKRGVKYLFTPYYVPLYGDFVPLFEGREVSYDSWNRKKKILKEVGGESTELEAARDEVKQAVKKHGIESKFKLEAEFGEWGEYKLYSFRD